MARERKSGKKHRVHTAEFKVKAVRRMEQGECVSAISRELGVQRGMLYFWRSVYQQGGPAALERKPGRERQTAEKAAQDREREAARQIAELERKVGRQALAMDFLQRAFKRVEEQRRKSTAPGGTASTKRSNG